jgi:type IV pilus assembly protein PilE
MRAHAPAGAAGFTLLELIVVTAILAILAAFALPAYQSQMAKGRRADAMSALSAVQQAQERLRSKQPSYASELTLLNLPERSPGGHYDIALAEVSAAGYTVSARARRDSPQARDQACAQLALQMSGGNVVYSARNAAGDDSSAMCWPQ